MMTKTSKGYRCVKGGFINSIKKYPNLYDQKYNLALKLDSNILISPLTPDGHRIKYTINEFDNVTDSSNY